MHAFYFYHNTLYILILKFPLTSNDHASCLPDLQHIYSMHCFHRVRKVLHLPHPLICIKLSPLPNAAGYDISLSYRRTWVQFLLEDRASDVWTYVLACTIFDIQNTVRTSCHSVPNISIQPLPPQLISGPIIIAIKIPAVKSSLLCPDLNVSHNL